MMVWCYISIHLLRHKWRGFRRLESSNNGSRLQTRNWRCGATWTSDRRKKICNTTDSPLVIPTIWYDAYLNVFHYKSVEHLFPYFTQYERKSRWSWQIFMFSAVELIFWGQALMFVPIIAGNPKHRPYPRSLKNENTRWRDNINTIRQEAPLINRKRTLCQDFRQNREGYVINSTTY